MNQQLKDTFDFLADVGLEVRRARGLFPDPSGLMTALTEEVGELARALLDESTERVREEAIQVAAMAARVAIEMDPTLSALRASRGLK